MSGGRVFVGSSVTSGDNFFAFDATSGAPLWSANVGPASPDTQGGIGIGASPAVSGGIVVAGGADAAYYAMDVASGQILWRNALDVGPSGFPWASPLIADGRVYVGISSQADNPPVRGELRCLDLASGALLAQGFFVPPGDIGAGIWNSPALSPDGATIVVATGEDDGYDGPYNRAMVSLDPATLQILQANKQGTPGQDDDWATTPVIFHDAQGRTLVGATHKNGTFYAYALDAIGAGPIWLRAVGVNVGMMAAYDPDQGAGGTLFFMGDSGQLFAVDPATGQDRWPPVTPGVSFGNMAIANGLIFTNANGQVQVINEVTGLLLRTLAPAQGGPSFSGVAVTGGVVYWLSGGYLNAWGVP